MCKRLIFLPSFVVMLALAGNALAQIDPASVTDGHVYLLENVGADVPDDSANNNTANLIGNPQVVDGLKGKALQFDGIDDGVHIPDSAMINLSTHQNHTVVAVFKCDDVDKTAKQVVYDEGGTTRGLTIYVHEGLVYTGGWNLSDYTPEWTGTYISAPINSNTWYAVAMIVRDGTAAQEDDKFEMWMNGELVGKGPGAELRSRSNDCAMGYHNSQVKFHDGNVSSTGSYFEGAIDEVWILNQALTQVELSQWAGKPWPYAFGPDPADGALHEGTWVTLSWKPGKLAVSHDVYMGVNFDDVNNATRDSDLFRGNQTTDFYIAGFPGYAYPEGLVPGTSYYWRIDEVNEADPNSPWKGAVWSFSVPSLIAYNPTPTDEAKLVNPDDVTLSWTPGFNAKLHYVYFGDDFEVVSNATGALPLADITYSVGTLEKEKTYYWRVDEFDGFTTHKGNIWSFTTKPDIVITDPELLCWWTLEEGEGTSVLDWSGHGADGQFVGNPKWTKGYDGGGLSFNGAGDSVIYNFADETWTAYTLAVWAKSDILGQSNNSSICATYLTTGGGFQFSYDALNNYQYHADVDQVIGPASLGWVHLAVTYDGTIATAYYNGDFVATFTPAADDLLANKYAIGVNRAEDNWFAGSIDEFRVYSRALSQEEIQYIMRGDPLVAWNPSPLDGTNPDIDAALPLSWSAGDNASQHDVYFGLDEAIVENVDSSDTTGIYRGRQNATTYTPSEGVEWGGGPYYWRIDEVNTDGTITKGRIWSFTVADFILVEDFESYTDDDVNGEAIWQHWIDGFGVPDNGAQVGYLLPPYAEQTIVNSGNQSMPLLYDNTAGVTNSEAVLALTAPRNWNRDGLTDLSLWFRGYPASVGSFVEAPAGTFTMTGAGADIWGTADAFHYAFKTLTGPGSIVARVNSVENTHVWAKAGVMIRETLDAGSKHAFVCVTPGSGAAFQIRVDTDIAMTGTTEAGITAPHWVKLERDVIGNFTASRSTNGTTWQPIASAVPVNIPMTSNVYIGLALTSHDAAATCRAVFSNVTTTGTVSGQWAHQDVGITTNAAEPMYVELSNANGTAAIAAHEDPAAATIDVWTEWRIPLQAFADQGINLTDVDSIAIGLGSKSGVPSSGGSGTMYFDDIRLYPPAPEPEPQP
jgi:hypothetical protein